MGWRPGAEIIVECLETRRTFSSDLSLLSSGETLRGLERMTSLITWILPNPPSFDATPLVASLGVCTGAHTPAWRCPALLHDQCTIIIGKQGAANGYQRLPAVTSGQFSEGIGPVQSNKKGEQSQAYRANRDVIVDAPWVQLSGPS